MYNLLKAVQSVVYALFRVNIFANASAKSYGAMAGGAKKAKEESKQLAGVHDEINNIQSNENSDSGGGGSASSPSFDLSDVDSQMSPFAQKLYDFFKPLKESWDKYGPSLVEQIKTTAEQIGYLLSSVWGSFEDIITNGTVYTTLELILTIIGNIAEALANAWNYHGNGDAIVQNMANALNNLLTAINNFVTSDKFQEWLNKCSDKLKIISDKIAEIDWQPIVDGVGNIAMALGTIALNIIDICISALKWLSEHPDIATILVAIGVALAIVGTVISVISTVLAVLTPIATALNIAILPLIGIIAAIIAVVALVIVIGYELIKHWDDIKEAVIALKDKVVEKFTQIKDDVVEKITNLKEKAKELWDNIKTDIKEKIEQIKENAINKFNNIKDDIVEKFNNIKTNAQQIWNNIKTTITDKITNVKTNISNALNNIKSTWSNIWTSLKTTVENIWNGIWNAIRNTINRILGGIENFANGIVRGINTVLSALDGVVTAVGSVIGIDISVPKLSEISLPRLATGNVAYEETLAIFGEYAGANNNPEITTPQSIMEETFERVLSRCVGTNNQSINLTVNVSNQKLGQILLEDLRSMKRQTGKDIEAIG